MKIDKRRKQTLIIEGESSKLKTQGLSIGRKIQAEILRTNGTNPVDLIEAETDSSFETDFDIILNKYRNPCNNIVLIGHSNQSGFKLTTGNVRNWEEIGKTLELLRPRKLLLLACYAGELEPCEKLFQTIPSLKLIRATPNPVGIEQDKFITEMVSLAINNSEKPYWFINFIQAVNALGTGRWMFNRTREEFENGELPGKRMTEKGIQFITDKFNARYRK